MIKKILKVLCYEKILFTVGSNNNNNNNDNNNINNNDNDNNNNNNNSNNNNNNKSNKYPVILSRSPRCALRFFDWALLLRH